MISIEIRPARSWDECAQCQEIQKRIWWTPDSSDIVPASLLYTAHKNGGLLLGAFEGARMVGFVFSFLAVEGAGDDRQLKHCSHILGVLPEFRAKGIGYGLKRKQRELLKSQNLSLATWTFDPLQAVNAWLNIDRLGAIARRYICDAYGKMHDPLNAGIASDRFEVEWWLNNRRVEERIDSSVRASHDLPREAQPIYELEYDERGLARVGCASVFDGSTCYIEIPADINLLKSIDLGLARGWRAQTRVTFQSAFEQNYTVVEFSRWSDTREHVAYILKRDWQVE
jgi:predicted GNAT superfamily acetyltransferase